MTPARFVALQPGSHIQYYDDTLRKDPKKSLSARSFIIETARRKQCQRCAVTFSLQAFGERRIKEELWCFHTMGVDVDLVAPLERHTVTLAQIDERKEQYLQQCLASFPLQPHWLTETRHGFHLLFRVTPQREAKLIEHALSLNRRLVQRLRGDLNAVLLTQVLRVPGTLQFKTDQPFLVRLLVDNGGSIPPYSLEAIEQALCDDEQPPVPESPHPPIMPPPNHIDRLTRWKEGLNGAAEGLRNITATSIVGKILAGLPQELWTFAGLGALKEWNLLNPIPLHENELTTIYRSIARREQAKRQARYFRTHKFSSSTFPTPQNPLR